MTDVPVSVQKMLWAQPCRLLCRALICFVPSLRLVLCLSPLLPLTPFSGLACRFSGPCAPLLPSGCAWVVPPGLC